jgi:hypothetical protein
MAKAQRRVHFGHSVNNLSELESRTDVVIRINPDTRGDSSRRKYPDVPDKGLAT